MILDLGDLVTHQAVQRASDAGLLDSFLAGVYRGGDITFSRDEMRAGIAGDSTVDKASGGASVVDELIARADAGDRVGAPQAPDAADDADTASAQREQSTHGDDAAEHGSEPALTRGQPIGQRIDP